MEENNVKKVNISTFLLIIFIIVIIIMVVCIYKLNNEKITEIEKSKDLQSQVNSLNETVDDLQGKINSISETINSKTSNETKEVNNTLSTNETKEVNNTLSTNETKEVNKTLEYKITGEYYQKDAEGDEPFYTFSSNNTVEYGSLWMCSGTYTIKNDTIKINFTGAVDPDGNEISVEGLGVDETVELTIIDNNNLKDNSNGFIYTK